MQVSPLTFSQFTHEFAVMVGGFLFSLADEHHLLHVSPYISQHASTSIHFALKEAEQRVLDVLHSAAQSRQSLGEWPNSLVYMSYMFYREYTVHGIKLLALIAFIYL